MTKENLIVLAKIITAVESGGQMYGKGRYEDVTMPGTNSSLEKTVTLGAGQFYGAEAYKLVLMIYTADSEGFKKLDTCKPSIASMIDGSHDWVAEKWTPNSGQRKVLKALISSETGKKCQDELLASQMETYTSECVKLYPKADYRAQMMFAEVRHLAGLSGAKRIFNRCKTFTLDDIMEALRKDQDDTSSSNQAGDKKYWSRHVKCREFIEKYAKEDKSVNTAEKSSEKSTVKSTGSASATACPPSGGTMTDADKLLLTAAAEVGYLEKRSTKSLDSKTDNSGSLNYTKYWRDIKPSYQGSQWCACFVSWCMWKTFGKEEAKRLLSNIFVWTYCPDIADAAPKRLYKLPQRGDIILFYKNRGSEGGWRFGHTGIVETVTATTVTTIEGNTSSGSAVIANGGGVCRKTYKLSELHSKTRFYRPPYKNAGGNEESTKSVYETEKKLCEEQQWIGEVTTLLNVRTGPGKEYSVSAFYPQLAAGDRVGVCDVVTNSRGEKWYFIIIANEALKKNGKAFIHDFVRAGYIRRV